jgi:hypothetical protein
MEAAGSYLQRGFSREQIGRRLDPPRSEDWVAARVAEVRAEMARQALETAGDELDAELRARLETYV